jgi:peptide/nickel transport system permease protein
VISRSGSAAGGSASSRGRRRNGFAILGRATQTRRGAIGLTLAGVVVGVAIVGPFVTPHSPTALLDVPFTSPNSAYPLGTDVLGRDVLSRLLCGGWVLLAMAVAATIFGVVTGAAAGISAAYLRGRADGVIMRTVDVLLAFPQLVFALLLVSIIGPKLWIIVLAVGLTHAPQVARVLRAAALDVSERPYVKAVELEGVSAYRVMTSEILPNLVTPLMVEAGIRLTYSIVVMAGLSFLGFGQAAPAPNWGIMINENRVGIQSNPWAVVAPAVLIALLTIGTNTFTDAVARVAIGVERKPQELALFELDTIEAGR